MDPTILITIEPHDETLAAIRSEYPRAELRMGPVVTSTDEVLSKDLMVGADILFCEVPPANFDDFDCLKWIQLTSHGYAQVFGLPMLERGIRVSNGLGTFDIPIAEWNILMMLYWDRHMPELLQNQKNCVWDRAAQFQSELRGKVVGFYGYGGIARETARLCKAMGLEVWALKADGTIAGRRNNYCVEGTGDPDGVYCDRVFSPADQEEFLSGVDYLIFTLPLNKHTEGLIGEKQLRMLKSSAVLINPSRAPIIEEEAMIRCMRENWIRAASMDVHYAYPLPPEHPLWSMPNVVLTPHISGSCESPHFLDRGYDIFFQNLKRFLAGEPLLNELTPEQLKGG